MVTILVMSTKLATYSFLKVKIFWEKAYNVIVYMNDVTNKILSRESTYIAVVVMWPTSGKSNTSMKEVIITSVL